MAYVPPPWEGHAPPTIRDLATAEGAARVYAAVYAIGASAHHSDRQRAAAGAVREFVALLREEVGIGD